MCKKLQADWQMCNEDLRVERTGGRSEWHMEKRRRRRIRGMQCRTEWQQNESLKRMTETETGSSENGLKRWSSWKVVGGKRVWCEYRSVSACFVPLSPSINFLLQTGNKSPFLLPLNSINNLICSYMTLLSNFSALHPLWRGGLWSETVSTRLDGQHP